MVLILTGFCLNLFHMIETKSNIYIGINILGGLALTVYAVLIESIPFAVLNGIWFLVAVYSWARR
jgi:hypothetical protein